MRYTPAGLPALDFELRHESELHEDGQRRNVRLQMRAIAIGRITQELEPLALGASGSFVGFLAQTRNGRGLLFHVTGFEPASD